MFKSLRGMLRRNDDSAQLVMTTTDELFLPSRIVYRVFDREKVEAKFRELGCMSYDRSGGRWTWEYDHEAKRMGFPPAYEGISPERQPVVLASCYWVEPDALHVYVRSTLRLTKFLSFFDRHIPRTCAQGEFFDEYNLLTVHDPQKPLPGPEDYFLDESKIVFFDAEAAVQNLRTAEQLCRETERTLEPLERHRLTAFYEDGEAHLTGAMLLRELLAMKQHQSDTPIRPYDVILESLRASESAAPSSSEPAGLEPTTTDPASAAPVASPSPGEDEEPSGFSFQRWDPVLKEMVWEVTSAPGPREQYVVHVGCCDNPVCDCRVLEAWLRPLHESGPSGEEIHLRLLFDEHEVHFTLPERPNSQRLAREMGTRFTSDDWLVAQGIYESDKADSSEPTDASKLDICFPNAVRADPSALVQYQEVFPYARNIRFETEGRPWVVFERYCSNPDCDCTNVFLDVAPAAEGGPQRRARVVKERDVTGIQWDYAGGRLTVRKQGPAGSPPAARLFLALKGAYPDLLQRVRRRHGVLRQLHAKARNKPPQTRVEPSRPQPKVGRNDPCPCGSGLKYKKCCGKN